VVLVVVSFFFFLFLPFILFFSSFFWGGSFVSFYSFHSSFLFFTIVLLSLLFKFLLFPLRFLTTFTYCLAASQIAFSLFTLIVTHFVFLCKPHFISLIFSFSLHIHFHSLLHSFECTCNGIQPRRPTTPLPLFQQEANTLSRPSHTLNDRQNPTPIVYDNYCCCS
jgi:hypothetical protein